MLRLNEFNFLLSFIEWSGVEWRGRGGARESEGKRREGEGSGVMLLVSSHHITSLLLIMYSDYYCYCFAIN
jgi:hypothetical protein